MTREHYLDRLKARRRSIFEEFQVAYQSTEGVPAGWICPLTEGSVALCHAFVKSYRYEDAGVLEEYVCMDGVVEDPDVREMLRRIADATDGKYFLATDAESLRGIYDEINSLEKSEIEVSVFTQRDELAGWLLIPVSALILLEILARGLIFRAAP